MWNIVRHWPLDLRQSCMSLARVMRTFRLESLMDFCTRPLVLSCWIFLRSMIGQLGSITIVVLFLELHMAMCWISPGWMSVILITRSSLEFVQLVVEVMSRFHPQGLVFRECLMCLLERFASIFPSQIFRMGTSTTSFSRLITRLRGLEMYR